MVLGLCRRVLNQEQDAEDAFQATFLVLALKAKSIRKQGSLGSWLYGVACRLALKMKAQTARRRLHERRAVPMVSEAPNGDQDWTELRPLLDEELQHLPEKYRAPLVLCYFEGKTQADAAQELGCAIGSMSKRLSRGRALLRTRLVRRGVSLSTLTLGTLMADKTRAALTAPLLKTSVQAALQVASGRAATGVVSATAAHLAEGALQKMLFTKLRIGIALVLGVTTALCGAGLAAHTWGFGPAEDDPPAEAAQDVAPIELPEDLALVPEGTVAFVRLAVADLYESDLFKAVTRLVGDPLPEPWKDLEKKTGLALAEIRSLAIFFVLRDENGGTRTATAVALTTKRPYARERIRETIAPEGKEQQIRGKTFFMGKNREAVSFISDRTLLLSEGDATERLLGLPAPASLHGPLGPALKLATRGHTLVAGFRVPAEMAQELLLKQPLPAPYAFVKPLLSVEAGSLVVDLNNDAEAKLRTQFPDEAVAKQAHESAKTGLYLIRQQLAADAPPDWEKDPFIVQALKEAETLLKSARLSQDGKTLQLAAETKASTLTAFALPAMAKMRTASSRMQDMNNLKQIALAMFNYASANQDRFPPAAISDANGKPLLSWRVAILPFLEQDTLYKQFKLDEPWDGPHNRQLLARMPTVYAIPGQKAGNASMTHYQASTGKGTVFQGNEGTRILDITDGTSNTLLVVEAADPVPWTKPADLPYDPAKPLPRLGGHFPEGFNAAFCDGSVRFLSKTIEDVLLRALITRNGGEVIDLGRIP
jgi:RNA polymerase sigma factor (sigma-70 family)